MDPIHALNCGTWAPAGRLLLWLISPGRLKPTAAFFRTMRTHQTGSAVHIVDQLVVPCQPRELELPAPRLDDLSTSYRSPIFPSAFRTQCLHRDAECITEGLLLVSSLLLYKICIFVPIRPFYIHGLVVVHGLPCSWKIKEYAEVRHVTAGKFTALFWIFAPYFDVLKMRKQQSTCSGSFSCQNTMWFKTL